MDNEKIRLKMTELQEKIGYQLAFSGNEIRKNRSS